MGGNSNSGKSFISRQSAQESGVEAHSMFAIDGKTMAPAIGKSMLLKF